MPSTPKHYIGLMSGTSVDCVDAVLVDLSQTQPILIVTHNHAIPENIRQAIIQLCLPGEDGVNRLGRTDVLVGELFADAVQALLKKSKFSGDDIVAIGTHGQTIRHHPETKPPFTIQIGDPNTIAARTNITTVADFRRKDVANGGQGAPFAPAFHQIIRQSPQAHIILNIGGIANITYLPEASSGTIIGFDTGPGNTLLDAWCNKHIGQACDTDGQWANSGKIDAALLNALLEDPYFKQPSPKSTGREHFNLSWLNKALSSVGKTTSPRDVQATLVELTTRSIASSINNISHNNVDVLVCGGGVHNQFLMQRLKETLQPKIVKNIADYSFDPDWIEAMAFAWFAQQTLVRKPIDLTHITGAKKPAVLGGIYHP